MFPNQEGSAKTDVLECTRDPTPYSFPNNNKITLWDFPGVNTPSFPIETFISFLRKQKLNAKENKK